MLSDFLSPIDVEQLFDGETFAKNQLRNIISIYENNFPELEGIKIAIIGVQEEAGARNNEGTKHAPDHVRKALYRLYRPDYAISIADLGNIKAGNTYQDTLYAIKSVCGKLLYNQVIPIIIGGSHDLTYGQFLAYEEINETVNVTAVDEQINIKENEEKPSSDNFLLDMFLHEPNYLFNFSQIGHQSYFVDPETLHALEKLHFDCYRVGVLNHNIEEVEAIIRDSDVVSFDVSAIKASEAPGHARLTPNGFDGEQACRIARYAGISDKTSSFGIYEINPLFDDKGLTSVLAAQMIWYFVDGYYNRVNDIPQMDKSSFIKYMVDLEEHGLTFWKSQKSGRWWMEVPFNIAKEKFKRHHLVSCSYSDYETAMQGDVPDRWIKAYDKLS